MSNDGSYVHQLVNHGCVTVGLLSCMLHMIVHSLLSLLLHPYFLAVYHTPGAIIVDSLLAMCVPS